MSKGTRSIMTSRTAPAVLLALALACALVLCAGCEELGSTSPAVTAVGDTVQPPPTQSVMEPGAEPTTSESDAEAVETSTTYRAPDVFLDESDFAKQIRLQVGDRVRVDLPAHPLADKGEVTSVEWRYSTGGVVQQIDAGTSTTDGFVTECWLEVEAVAPGDVTIRTIYVHEDTTTRAKWVIYLAVAE